MLLQVLQDRYGGFNNSALIEDFAYYARTGFRAFGDRVKHWITFNEPNSICRMGYGEGIYAPGETFNPGGFQPIKYAYDVQSVKPGRSQCFKIIYILCRCGRRRLCKVSMWIFLATVSCKGCESISDRLSEASKGEDWYNIRHHMGRTLFIFLCRWAYNFITL